MCTYESGNEAFRNEMRASWAQQGLDAFQLACRTDDDDAIADLICNLLHLARERGLDPLAELSRAQRNWEGEEADAEGEE